LSGLATKTQAVTAGDRGCLPSIFNAAGIQNLDELTGIGTAVVQAVNAQWTLGSDILLTASDVSIDVQTIFQTLCFKLGTCCSSNLCNAAQKIILNQLNLMLVIGVLLISQLYF